jgi:two-component system, cell cycle sensor histidine kinase and response regulator CckA
MVDSSIMHVHQCQLIYLVDDEEPCLDLAELSLLADGYELKKFQNPETALASLTNEPRKPSLLLTDYAMSQMTGLELSAKCREAHPNIKIVMVSGTATSEVMHHEPGMVDKFIPKPYQPSDLANTVRALLNA